VAVWAVPLEASLVNKPKDLPPVKPAPVSSVTRTAAPVSDSTVAVNIEFADVPVGAALAAVVALVETTVLLALATGLETTDVNTPDVRAVTITSEIRLRSVIFDIFSFR